MKRYINVAEWSTDPRVTLNPLFAEIDESGWVSREIGLDEAKHVVYKFPWPGRPNFRGSCDLATFATKCVPDAITPSEFEAYWNAPVAEADVERWIQIIQGPPLAARLRRLLRLSR